MDSFYAILIGSALGGLVSGVIALLVGGVGGQWRLQKQLFIQGDLIGELHQRVEREVKRANVMTRFTKEKPDPLVDALAQQAANAPGSTIAPRSGTDVLGEARRRGLVR